MKREKNMATTSIATSVFYSSKAPGLATVYQRSFRFFLRNNNEYGYGTCTIDSETTLKLTRIHPNIKRTNYYEAVPIICVNC